MILAAFPTGVANITVNGLHQWDYGQQLKIKAPDLPAMVEVHFACAGMDEAIVRSCSVANGEGTVAIPDKCLEQTSPVYAWIYEIDGTAGTTTKTILLNIIARARPQTGEDIPVDISNQYTEAITVMNAKVAEMGAVVDEMESLVEQVSEGTLPMSYAAQAGQAQSATHALSADRAESAFKADEAGTVTGIFKTPTRYRANQVSLPREGYYLVIFRDNGTDYPALLYFDIENIENGIPVYAKLAGSSYYLKIEITDEDQVLTVRVGDAPSASTALTFSAQQSVSVALIYEV